MQWCTWSRLAKNSRSRFLRLVFCGAFYVWTIHPTAKVSEGTNRNMPTRNTLVQLLALYTNHDRHNVQRQRQTDGQTDGRRQSYCVAVRSAKSNMKYRPLIHTVHSYNASVCTKTALQIQTALKQKSRHTMTAYMYLTLSINKAV